MIVYFAPRHKYVEEQLAKRLGRPKALEAVAPATGVDPESDLFAVPTELQVWLRPKQSRHDAARSSCCMV